MAEYLKLDSRKVTFREYWNITRSPTVLIPWIAKLLGIPMTFGSGFRRVEAVRELEVPESAFSMAAREKLQPWLEQCLSVGFYSPRYFSCKSLAGEAETSFISLLHSSGQCSIRLMHTVSNAGSVSKTNVLAAIVSELNDGTYLATANQRARFLSAPQIIVNRLLNGNPAQLLASHEQKLSELHVRNRPRTMPGIEEQDAMWDRYEKLSNDFGVQRGIYVPLNTDEQKSAIQHAATVESLKSQGVENADVLAAMRLLQEKKRSWSSAIFILIVSALLFVGFGSRRWSWEYVLMLVPILLIHESGHYIAMRFFNYRNLRMFFIPFFGAAVSGRHYNVAGWKKVIVSLMGPVPGILLGSALGVAGLMLHQPWLVKLALVALILNGFNLLPILPLDGGWVFHTLIFSRHYVLDVAFRVLAVIALAAGGALSNDKILMYLAIPMGLGIPATYRLARVVTSLRSRQLPAVSPDDQTVPIETAQTIIAELKQILPKAHTTKTVAEQTLQVFETLNARPPGFLASAGLLFAHFASVGLAVVFAVILIVGQRGDFASIFTGSLPTHRLACGSVLTWRGELYSEADGSARNTIVATFLSSARANNTFAELTNDLPANATLTRFGQTLLLSLPDKDEAGTKGWMKELRQRTRDVFVDNNTNFPSSLSLSFRAPDEGSADKIEAELREYLNTLPNLSLLPPWAPDDGRAPGERARHRLARQTYLKLVSHEGDAQDSQLSDLSRELVEARRQGDKAQEESLSDQIRELAEHKEDERVARIRAGGAGPVDTNVVDLFNAQRRLAEDETNSDAIAAGYDAMARLMGQASPDQTRFGAQSGIVTRSGLVITLTWVSLNRMSDGAPALSEWLCDRGCTGLKYTFSQGLDLGEDE